MRLLDVGNQNAVASGLKRALTPRFPDQVKDVVVMTGDGATCDIGLDMTLRSWFRRESITTVMFDKLGMADLAIAAGCSCAAVVSTARPRQIGKSFQNTVLVAREVGPTCIQIHTPCRANMKLKPREGILAAEERVETDYAFREHLSPEAERYLASLEEAAAEAAK